MRRKKTYAEPTWLIWEGDNFPRKLHSDSLVFYINEELYLDSDQESRTALARQIQKEGLVDSLGAAYKLLDLGWIVRAGFYYDDGDERFPIYCELDDPLCDWYATFVEVPDVL